MKVQELFPIGSVVKLRNGIRPLMIFGIKQTNLETNEEYDYIGCLLYTSMGEPGTWEKWIYSGSMVCT